MSFVTRGHFIAYIDAADPESPFIEVKMNIPIYTDRCNNWRGELEDEMRKLEEAIKDYVQFVKQMKMEDEYCAM